MEGPDPANHNYRGDDIIEQHEHDGHNGSVHNKYFCVEHNIEFARFFDFDVHNRIHHYIEPDDDFKRRLDEHLKRYHDLYVRLADH